jgi:hypothetical protein
MAHALLLARTLEMRAKVRVFLDIESIPPGVEFRDYVAEHIASSDAMVVMIGKDWLTLTGRSGERRIDDAEDQVRIEVRTAIDRGMPIFPVLVGGAAMPVAEELPPDLSDLAWRNALRLEESDWDACVRRLAEALPGAVTPVAPSSRKPEAGEFPRRFGDRWFSENVSEMDPETFARLVDELHRRNWEDWEIEKRVGIFRDKRHEVSVHPTVAQARAHAEEQYATPIELECDASDPIGRLVNPLSAALMEFERELGRSPRERDMADALGRLIPDAIVERKLDIPFWDPQPGAVDLWTADWRGRPSMVAELKLKDGNDIYESIWDLIKVLSLETLGHVEAGYLVVGSTVRAWERPVVFSEFFANQQFPLVDYIGEKPEALRWVYEGGRARPTRIPERVEVTLVGRSRYRTGDQEWELRAVKVAASGAWLDCEDGWPLR